MEVHGDDRWHCTVALTMVSLAQFVQLFVISICMLPREVGPCPGVCGIPCGMVVESPWQRQSVILD